MGLIEQLILQVDMGKYIQVFQLCRERKFVVSAHYATSVQLHHGEKETMTANGLCGRQSVRE